MKNKLSQNSTALLCDKKNFFLYQTPSYRTDKKERQKQQGGGNNSQEEHIFAQKNSQVSSFRQPNQKILLTLTTDKLP